MKSTSTHTDSQTLLRTWLALSILTWAFAIHCVAEEVTDADITSAINTELWADHAANANTVDVTTKQGIVTLKGTVGNLLAKERARAIAEGIVGVRAVVNTIEVEPVGPPDDREIADAVKKAWLMDPATDSYELEATAQKGIVTITGKVDSFVEKELSEDVAKGVRGVKGIENDIEVEYGQDRNDAEIRREIEARLENDLRVDDYLIDVEVNNGRVELSGVAGSQQERRQAYNDAWVSGVSSVSTQALEIEWWARDKLRRKSSFVARTDEEIKQAVEDAFRYDPRVWAFNPDVSVDAGTVTLSGVVDNLAAKLAAEQDARNTLGVWRVKNQLKVRTEIPSDEVLEKRVAEALVANPHVERYDITVEAYSGWTYLSGRVNTSFEKIQAERVSEKVKGVVGVVNNIIFDYRWVWQPDWVIREEVKEQLQWSAFVDEDDIIISVENGIVTLDGTVESWSESEEAVKNAFQAGAKDVNNFLTVDYPYYGPHGPGYYGNPQYERR